MLEWLDRLGYAEGAGALLSLTDTLGDRPYAAEIGDILSTRHGIAASYVYCIDDLPVVCFIDGRPRRPRTIDWLDATRKSLWNQGLVSVVFVVGVDEMRAFSVLRPDEPSRILPFSEAHLAGAWSAFDFRTGHAQTRAPSWFEPERRVDRLLLENLNDTVRELASHGLSRMDAEVLLAQVIFVRTLEQRGIVGDAYREAHGLSLVTSLIERGDGGAIDELLKQLGRTFKGDFLESTEIGPPKWATLGRPEFRRVAEFLEGDRVATRQRTFWGYDFSIIPVETVSGIYESFLAERQKDQGAYYTPRHLATVVVEQAFRDCPAPHRMSVYDGACGSGILLTTAFQKMLASAEGERGTPLPFKDRVQLLSSQVFGGDIDPTACWLTAFSLYLCLLERLSPADVELLQRDEQTQLPHLLIGSGTTEPNIRSGDVNGDVFHVDDPPGLEKVYDVVLSNPPWKEVKGAAREHVEAWLALHERDLHIPDGQVAAAFTHRVAHRLSPGGRMVLVLPLNLLIGIDSHGFRREVLERLRIERIINFGDLRYVLFPKAVLACGLLVARPRPRSDGPILEPGEVVSYYTPKADLSLAFGRIAFSLADRAKVHSSSIYLDPAILLHRFWGGRRDVDLMSRLLVHGTIHDFSGGIGSSDRGGGSRPSSGNRDVEARRGEHEPSPRAWFVGKGFHATDKNNKSYDLSDERWQELANLPYVATSGLPREHPLISPEGKLPRVREAFSHVSTPGGQGRRLYHGPRIIWPNGLSPERQIRASYTERTFAFQHTACAVGGVGADPRTARFITMYLRSSLATYLLIMNSYSVVADRWAVSKHEVMTLPFIPPDRHDDPRVVSACFDRVDDMFGVLGRGEPGQRGAIFESMKGDVEDVVAAYFGLSADERAIVADARRHTAKALLPRSYRRLNTSLVERPTQRDAERYTKLLRGRLDDWRDSRSGLGGFDVQAAVSNKASAFGAIRLRVTDDALGSSAAFDSDELVRSMLADIEKSLRNGETLGGLLMVPDVAIAFDDDVYIVKPMQRRFWLASAAFDDADRFVGSIDAVVMARRHASSAQ